ncbi:MAG: response regulator [Candidatus Fermentibacteria bacterium]
MKNTKRSSTLFGSLRFQVWKQLVLAILLISAVVYLYDGYKRTRISALESHSTQQTICAAQIISEISFKFELIRNVLERWSRSAEIVCMSDEILPSMERIITVHGSYISGVTRMDENGIIRYSVPYYEGTTGSDISYQKHIQQLMETHAPVLSDAVMTVQGYWAVIYHVPCFDEESSFRGSLSFLVPFREMFRKLFSQLLPESDTVPLVLSSDGLILFAPVEGHEGKHYTEVFEDDSGEMNVADASYTGRTDYMLTDFTTYVGIEGHPETMISTIIPFCFHETTWFLILSLPEATVMQNIAGLSNRWLWGMRAIILLAMVYSMLKVKVWITSKEEKKRESIAHLKNVLIRTVNQAQEIIVILDRRERVLYANRAAVRISGFGKKYLKSRISKIPFQSIEPSISEMRKEIYHKGTWRGVCNAKGTKNRFFKLDLAVSSVTDRDGDITNFIVIARDVTVQMEMERRLFQQQKMEAIGQLAGGIAHDFNNLLVGILGYAELLKKEHSGAGNVSKAADVIIAAVHRGSELTRQLLGYARMGKHQINRIDFGQCIRNVNDLLKRTLDQRIKVVLDLEEGIYVKGDSSQIEQVILNLAVNARDAMPEGGELKFSLKRETVPAEITNGRQEGGPLELAVLKTADTGSGIPVENHERIFEPFFTTKDEEGTGMGLATVYGIVANHGGWVDVESQSGSGAIFSVYLPLDKTGETEENEDSWLPERPSDGRGHTILVVDDESVVVATLTDLLSEIGYGVIPVPNGKRAIEVFSSDPGSFDAVVLDLSMPEMDGKECFERLRDIDPGVKVILITGFSRDGRVQELLDMGVKGFLQKPFRLKKLAAVLTDLIET